MPVSTNETSVSDTHTPLGRAAFPVKLIHKSNWRCKIDSAATDRLISASRGSNLSGEKVGLSAPSS